METASAPPVEPVDGPRLVPRIYGGLKREYKYQGVEDILSPVHQSKRATFALFAF